MIQCACWEWQRDDRGFSPYTPEESHQLETAFTARAGMQVVADYVVDFSNMSQRRKVGGHMTRTVRRSVVNLPASQDITAYWMWSEQPSKLVMYGLEASVDIELAYQNGSLTLDLSKCPCNLPYSIDFRKMCQTRHRYNTVRTIRRIALRHGTSLQSLLRIPSSAPHPGFATPLGTVGKMLVPGVHVNPVLSYDPASGHAMKSTRLHSGYGYGHTPTSITNPSINPVVFSGHTPANPNINPVVSSGHTPYSYGKNSNGGLSSGATNIPAPSVISYMPSTSPLGSKFSTAGVVPTYESPVVTTKSKSKVLAHGKSREVRGQTSNHGGSVLLSYARKVKKLKSKDDEICPICMNKLSEPSGFEDDDPLPIAFSITPNVYKLRKCAHILHYPCLSAYIKNSSEGGFLCPTCKKSYGVKTGDMPTTGTMTVVRQNTSLPGHSGYNTIEITYNFSPGQDNGRYYRANGFPRKCYLPDSPKGQKVLKLLRIAWERRLTFTIGTSVTTGATNTVVWNEIHHKTESSSNYSGHGYPDPHYLDRVLLELAAQGVEERQEEEEEEEESSDSSDEENCKSTEPIIITDSDESL